MRRCELLSLLGDRLFSLPRAYPLRVGIDGVDASGKTSLADDLAAHLRLAGARPILRASLDGFHNPRAVRYRQGPASPDGYYADSFDLPALRAALLDPLGPACAASPTGCRLVRTACFDFRADAPVASASLPVAPDAILLFDGVFLQRPELDGCWDHCIFLQVSFETALERAVQRDLDMFGSPEAVRARYLERYIPAQRRYLAERHPAEHAGTLIDNTDPLHPILIR